MDPLERDRVRAPKRLSQAQAIIDAQKMVCMELCLSRSRHQRVAGVVRPSRRGQGVCPLGYIASDALSSAPAQGIGAVCIAVVHTSHKSIPMSAARLWAVETLVINVLTLCGPMCHGIPQPARKSFELTSLLLG